MQKLASNDLMSLEQYAKQRSAFREKVLAHKRNRRVAVGPNMVWLFEDRLTVQYQVQEMLRAERIFESEGIEEELEAYNPLIPDGSNWKATLLIEFANPDERARQLALLRGVEDRCWVQVAGHTKTLAIADEDLERANDEKTSAVHFLRFELDRKAIASLTSGAALALGADHDQYRHTIDSVPEGIRAALAADFD
jgi:hypothetical protein